MPALRMRLRPWLHSIIGVPVLSLGTACSSVRPGDPLYATTVRAGKQKSPPIRTIDRLNPIWWLGNADSPEPPDWYCHGAPDRKWRWQLRNPMHNFTFYVVGLADTPAVRTGRFPTDVFPPDGGWNWAIHRYYCIVLPFVAFDGGWCRFYFGWRERGNLGAKFNVSRTTRRKAPP